MVCAIYTFQAFVKGDFQRDTHADEVVCLLVPDGDRTVNFVVVFPDF